MTERIIEIADTAAFLSLENHLLKIKLPTGSVSTIPVGEIQCLIVANPAVTITAALLSELAAVGVAVVISGNNRLPTAMQIPLAGNYIQNERFRAQIDASRPLCKRLWQQVVREKVRRQGALLQRLRGDDFGLFALSEKVLSGDSENIEGRAAVLYWKNLFGTPFLRDRDSRDNNMLLNYGYAVLRGCIARTLTVYGLLPALGLHHRSGANPFNLADDLIEPFRPIVDLLVFREGDNGAELTPPLKRLLFNCLNLDVLSGGQHHSVSYAVERLVQSLGRALEEREAALTLPEMLEPCQHRYE